MKVIAYLLGFGTVAISSCLILYTRPTMDKLKGLFETYQPKYLSVIPAVFGFLYLICASAIIYPWVFRIIGLMAFVEAIFIFTNPHNIYQKLLDWYLNISDQTQRLFGIIGIIFGTVILTWIK